MLKNAGKWKSVCGVIVMAIAISIAPSASAADITFTVTGLFGGNLSGSSFKDRSLTIRATADDRDIQEAFGETHIALAKVVIEHGTARWTLSDPGLFFFNSADAFGGIVDASASSGLFRFNYGQTGTSFPITFYTDPLTASFATSGGQLQITTGREMQLATSFGNVPAVRTAAVPEPATWGMMMLGFAVAGVSLRRRKRFPHACGQARSSVRLGVASRDRTASRYAEIR